MKVKHLINKCENETGIRIYYSKRTYKYGVMVHEPAETIKEDFVHIGNIPNHIMNATIIGFHTCGDILYIDAYERKPKEKRDPEKMRHNRRRDK